MDRKRLALGAYLLRYAQEASWPEDNRGVSNGDQVQRVSMLARKHKPSVDFCGYWQPAYRQRSQGGPALKVSVLSESYELLWSNEFDANSVAALQT
jgi:hypothetical protein